ncbi:TlpA family protein disulfide reductase [Deferrisoma camini]|uniref:TlpA family protein disulfide reductase n=1 Tax=Deferrisoma camini TaxID=1035120 RepID=UPI00046CDBBA|nr:TlpA disulfide reductase family protein [Deferrisoma camini]
MARKSLQTLLVVIGAVALWSSGAIAEQKKMTPLDIPMIGDIEMLKPGDKAPDFTLEDIEGRSFQLSKEVPQKVHLLVFWSIFCEPCKAEMPLIERLYEEYRDKGFEVIAVALDGEPMKKSIVGLVKQQGYKFRVFIDKLAPDESFVVADPYGVAGTPTLYLVGRDGKIAFAEVGLTDKEVLENEIRKALGR